MFGTGTTIMWIQLSAQHRFKFLLFGTLVKKKKCFGATVESMESVYMEGQLCVYIAIFNYIQ